MKIRSIAVVLMLAVLTGCSTGVSVESLLTPPKLDGQQNDIYQALINSTGSAIKLKYPKGGDFRSPFVVRNFDTEAGEEAMVFYEPQSVQTGEAALRLKFLDQYDGKWQVVYDIACIGTEIESISFVDFGKSGSEDILLRTSMLNQTEKVLTVINYSDGIPKELYTSSYSSAEVFDLNYDGSDELVNIITDKSTGESSAVMLRRTDSGLQELGRTPLIGTHSEIINVTKGFISENVPAMFIDHSRGQGQYGTSVVYCHGDRLFSPDSVGENAETSLITRFTNDYMADIRCTDIDGDGYVEIPSMTPLPGYEALAPSAQLCAVNWYTVENGSFVREHYSYHSSKYKFVLHFPDRWQKVVTAVPNLRDDEIIFIRYNSYSGLEVGSANELMRIRIVNKSNSEAVEGIGDAIVLAENDEILYCCIPSNPDKAGQLALTESELRNGFVVF